MLFQPSKKHWKNPCTVSLASHGAISKLLRKQALAEHPAAVITPIIPRDSAHTLPQLQAYVAQIMMATGAESASVGPEPITVKLGKHIHAHQEVHSGMELLPSHDSHAHQAVRAQCQLVELAC